MKESRITVAAVGLVILVLVAYLFVCQVRITEVAVHYRAGRVQKVINADPQTKDESGWYLRIPWLDKFVKFDRRTRVLDGKLVETQLQDNWQVIISMYAAWHVSNPVALRAKLKAEGGRPDQIIRRAEAVVKEIIQNETSKVVGKRRFEDFVNTDKDKLKFREITDEIAARVRGALEKEDYGITVGAFGVRRIAIPQATTAAVFERMNTERNKIAETYRSEGQREKTTILARADAQKKKIIAEAQAEAIETRRAGEEEEAQYYVEFAKAPELAIFLQRLETSTSISRQASESGSPITFLLGPEVEPWTFLFEGPEGRAGASGHVFPGERAGANQPAAFSSVPELDEVLQGLEALMAIAQEAKESGSSVTVRIDPEMGTLKVLSKTPKAKEEE